MPRTYREAYERLLPLVEKPGRYLGNERGSVRKDVSRVRLRLALAFPEVYEIAQSHLGLQILYDILNRRPDVAAERVYAPWPDMETLLRARGLPLVSLESHTALVDFHVVGVSLQYELTYTNLLTMLELGGVPLRAAQRGPQHPLVIAGGPCAFNPEPLAPFLDGVLLGDGEEAIGDICDVVLSRRETAGHDRAALLRALAAIPGFYVPAFFAPRHHADGTIAEVVPLDPARPQVRKRVLFDLDRFAPPPNPIVPNLGVVHDRASIEVMRGCVKGCRFCQAGYVYRPLRERNPERVVEETTRLMARTGYEEVSLLSLSTGDYSGVNPVLKELMDRLAPERVAVSLPSTRVDALSPRILEQIRRVRKTGFTLAPEAGTQRLRDVIQKEYREEELLEAARLFADLGWRTLKLYFMIGLPSETEEDVVGIAELAARVAAAGGGRLAVTASVSTFCPKPHTPFQWAGQLSLEETRARHTLLRRELGRRRIAFRWHDAELSFLEGIFSRGDRRLADVLETAQRRGARFDGWSDRCRMDVWRAALAEHGIDPALYLRRRPLGESLPWDHLDAGLAKRFLLQDLARAVRGVLTPDCSIERCTYCGACDFKAVRNVDYHPTGAKGGEHRGGGISRWAELAVPSDANDPLPAWETRMWRQIRTRVAERRPAGSLRGGVDAAPLPAEIAIGGDGAADAGGEGNAEEWLGAVPSSLAPASVGPPAVQRIRLCYRKVGPARFIGTRELGTTFLRAARRARLPVAFSQGHHPLPRLSFGPAPPLGVSSDGEYVDVELTASLDAAELVARLGAELPDGLEAVEASEVPRSAPSIESEIESVTYRVDLGELDVPPAPEAVAAAVARFAAAPNVPVTKRGKSGTRTVDARRFVLALEPEGPDRLVVELRTGPEGTLKASALVGELLGLSSDASPALRVHKIATRFRVATEPAAATSA
ncbi:MAG: TIGR03960 family B12-binding radical SAM protein [Deltaproteobacteria bacterium]|nr:MAG: TIGR03960 family B12-binding radical SAM protein [Deltaproteobacteria bacterium]